MKLLLIFSVLLVAVYCSKNDTATACPLVIDVQSVLYHLKQLDNVANINDGNRAAGTSGYQASMGYIIDMLGTTNLRITTQDFTFTAFKIIGDPKFSQAAPTVREFVYLSDFRILTGSGSGVATAAIIQIVPNLGCNAADYANFRPGAVAIIARGECPFTQKNWSCHFCWCCSSDNI
jgi:hypothetical protein